MKFEERLRQAGLKPELPFPVAEYERRIAAVRERMRARDIDLLIVSNTSNWTYLTGYDSTMPSCYGVGLLPLEGKPATHTAELEVPCVMHNSIVEDICVYDTQNDTTTADQLADVLLDRGYDRKTIGVEMGYPDTFAIGAYDTRSYLTLKARLPKATFVDTTELVLDERVVKTPAELDYMRSAGKLTWSGIEASFEATRVGATDNEIVAAGYHAMIAGGSELLSIDGMCMAGHRAGLGPHMPFKRTTLQDGDTVFLEYTGTYNRYNAPTQRAAVIGTPSPLVRRLADASLETLNLLIENIGPGRTGDDIAQVARKGLRPVWDEVWWHEVYGYSVGLGMQPTWTESPTYIALGAERELRPGMTFHLPICIFTGDRHGVGFSETVTVTENGCEVLTPGALRELVVR
ncbi:M24 family metallopeptidase [Embleya sp. NPDC059259]|uniref:M24 family metallopeptidase n=1 Tax=unclassified Embleya TaxID=2699296 RepID=UPI0036B066AB